MLAFVLLFECFLFSEKVLAVDVGVSHNTTMLRKATLNLERLVGHYDGNERNLNVDGLYGFRIAQGNI